VRTSALPSSGASGAAWLFSLTAQAHPTNAPAKCPYAAFAHSNLLSCRV